MKEYNVVMISIYGDSEENETLLANNLKYPELVQYVTKDENQLFVVNAHSGSYTLAEDFFNTHNIRRFKVVETA